MKLAVPVLYEDSNLLVIDKPAGLVTNRAKSVKGETLQDWAEDFLKINKAPSNINDETYDVFINRSGIVHRLDKDTSGCLIIAKDPASLADLLMQFKSRTVEKKYTALVHGIVSVVDGTVNAPIGRLSWRRGFFGILAGGKQAVTHFHVEETFKKEDEKFTLLSLKLETGRTHQIRVHLQYINHPVVADIFYAGKKRTKKAKIWCPRLFLHASKIAFRQPNTKKQIQVTSPLPAMLKDVLDQLVII